MKLDSSFCRAPDVGGAARKCTLRNLFCFIIKCHIPRLADLIDTDAVAGDGVAERGSSPFPSAVLTRSLTERADTAVAAPAI